MKFRIEFGEIAEEDYDAIQDDKSKVNLLKLIDKTLDLMETNLRHPSLNTHEYEGFSGKNGEKVFGAYVQNNTPNAYRILWHYGPGKGVITVIAII